jgi:hypothetical protein
VRLKTSAPSWASPDPRGGDVPQWLQAEPKSKGQWQQIENELRPGPWTDLPITALASFLKAHALGGKKWPKNGLTPDENRELFRSKNPEVVANLVATGLLHRFSNQSL